MKKLIELFKSYEHVLSEDSVMDHFRNILNKVNIFLLVLSCILYVRVAKAFLI